MSSSYVPALAGFTHVRAALFLILPPKKTNEQTNKTQKTTATKTGAAHKCNT